MHNSHTPPTAECVFYLWHIYSMEYYSTIKRKGWSTDSCYNMDEPWKDQHYILSERSQTQKAICCLIPFIWNVQNGQLHRDRKQFGGCQRLVGGGMGSDCQWVQSCFLNIYLITYLAALGLSYGTQDIYCRIWTLSNSMWDLAPWPAIEPGPLALGAQSLRHWTTREVPWISSWVMTMF